MLTTPALAGRCDLDESALPAHRIGLAALLVLLAAAVGSHAQTAGNWTKATPQANPGPVSGFGFAYDSGRGQAVLTGPLSDNTWVWNGSNWIRAAAQDGLPGTWGSAMAYDPAHSQTVLFTNAGQTWVWDGSMWTQKLPQTIPGVRGAAAYDSAHGQVVLFGGAETWVWDGSNWSKKSPQTSPPARSNHSLAYDAARGQVVLFGGTSSTNYLALSDTWVWDGVNWTQKSPSNKPSARRSFAMAYDAAHSQVVVFGGGDTYGYPNGETWVWEGSNWTQQSPQTAPSARSYTSAVYDTARGQVVLYGGIGDTSLSDTWLWTGSSAVSTQPTITSVISLSGFGGLSTVSPGSWVEIYGSRLSSTTRIWAGTDFTGNSAPTTMDGVQATIGGQKAFVEYVSATPGQVNVQVPSSVATGTSQPVVVINNGVSSAPVNVRVNDTAPGLLAPVSFLISGKQYAVAQLSDGTYVLPAGAISGVASRPAKPGETVVIYGIGFGSVTPAFTPGQIVTQTNQLVQSLQISFAGTPALVSYDGLTPSYVGLYQFNAVVPAVADSNLTPLTFSLGGVAGTQTLYIAVHQ